MMVRLAPTLSMLFNGRGSLLGQVPQELQTARRVRNKEINRSDDSTAAPSARAATNGGWKAWRCRSGMGKAHLEVAVWVAHEVSCVAEASG